MFSGSRHLLLFASGNLERIGGVQRSYQLLTQHLVDNGWKVTLVGRGNKPASDEAFQLAHPLPADVDVLSVRSFQNKANFSSLCKAINNINPDLSLIVNSSQPAFFFAQALHHLGRKYVYSMRGSSEYCLRYLWPCLKTLESVFLNAQAAHVLMPSYREFFRPAVRDNITIIPSQIEPTTITGNPDLPGPDGRFSILYSGRFSFEKRIDLLVKAFARLKDEFPDWDLHLYGAGPYEEKLVTMVSELNLENRVKFRFVQNTEEMYQVYPTFNLKVLPSEAEGCPMALREAMIHGVPVIAYAECSGVNEILTHGKDGLLVNNEDRVDSLTESLRHLMLHPEQRKSLGLQAIETASKYHPDVINRQWEQLLLSALDGNDKSQKPWIEDKNWAGDLFRDTVAKERYRDVFVFVRNPDLMEKYREEYATIYGNRLFNVLFYLEMYPEVKKSGVDPLLHYLDEGWRRGMIPSPEFDAENYRAKFMKGDDTVCPLYHFYSKGRFSGAHPVPISSDYYDKWPGRKISYTVENEAELELAALESLDLM